MTNCILENRLNFFIKKKKIKNILVITGKKSFNFSGFKKLAIYKKFKSMMTIFYKESEIPEIHELEYLIKKINIIKPDLIIALGGGCAIDYAKLANGLHNIKNLKKKIKNGSLKLYSKKAKLLAIPTTAGSGAEVTRFCVIYINKTKYSVEDDLFKPDFFSLIPKLVMNSKNIIRASSGFDAIAQAIESVFSKKANTKSLKYSLNSASISTKNYLKFVNAPNIINSKNMLNAAHLSGRAINIAKTNAPHALSYFFSSKFKIPHGFAVSIFFLEIIKFYYFKALKNKKKNLIKKFNLLFNSINCKNIYEFDNLFNKFYHQSGIKKYFYDLTKKNQLVKIKNFYYNTDRLKNSPIKFLKNDIKELLKKSFLLLNRCLLREILNR